jgi:hypothetical protein
VKNVNNKRFIAVVIILALLISFVGVQVVKFAKANPIPNTYASLAIDVPQNPVYNSNTVSVNFKADGVVGIGEPASVRNLNYSYVLDGNEPVIIENITKISDLLIDKNVFFYQYNLTGSVILPELSAGKHKLTIQLIYYSEILHLDNITLAKASTQFTVNIPQEPTPTQTAEPFPIPIFSTPTPTAEPFPTTSVMTVVIVVVIATIVLVVLIIVGLLRYIVKSKKAKS